MVRVVDLWNTKVPDFVVDARAEFFLASDEPCEVRWSDVFTFPFVRPEMTLEAIQMRYCLLHFAANVSEVQDTSVEMFCDANVRAAMGPESHTPWNTEGTDVLDTEILYRTKRCI